MQQLNLVLHHYKDHAFATFSGENPVQYKPSGKVDLLRISQRGFTATMKNLQACQFNIPEPREAKCCQPWLDTVYDPNERCLISSAPGNNECTAG